MSTPPARSRATQGAPVNRAPWVSASKRNRPQTYSWRTVECRGIRQCVSRIKEGRRVRWPPFAIQISRIDFSAPFEFPVSWQESCHDCAFPPGAHPVAVRCFLFSPGRHHCQSSKRTMASARMPAATTKTAKIRSVMLRRGPVIESCTRHIAAPSAHPLCPPRLSGWTIRIRMGPGRVNL